MKEIFEFKTFKKITQLLNADIELFDFQIRDIGKFKYKSTGARVELIVTNKEFPVGFFKGYVYVNSKYYQNNKTQVDDVVRNLYLKSKKKHVNISENIIVPDFLEKLTKKKKLDGVTINYDYELTKRQIKLFRRNFKQLKIRRKNKLVELSYSYAYNNVKIDELKVSNHIYYADKITYQYKNLQYIKDGCTITVYIDENFDYDSLYNIMMFLEKKQKKCTFQIAFVNSKYKFEFIKSKIYNAKMNNVKISVDTYILDYSKLEEYKKNDL